MVVKKNPLNTNNLDTQNSSFLHIKDKNKSKIKYYVTNLVQKVN